MEKMTFIFFMIIVAYLLFAFIRSRFSKDEKMKNGGSTQVINQPGKKEDCSEMHRAAIAAVIAAVMGNAPYAVKRVYAVATIDESRSNWRTAGRTETMTRKGF